MRIVGGYFSGNLRQFKARNPLRTTVFDRARGGNDIIEPLRVLLDEMICFSGYLVGYFFKKYPGISRQ
ncbi:hypothetical protein D7S86_09710 [Pararobbsia silviterrae]|uniref:Uncharacterized protein n=1 Tax=Pararobbsia silviterrae TaxID=1792498 RepID=A0A494Y8J6_9BURK|nr:hypothetical protein D7S86_09710 [Pararobbsia silviterrae]